MFRQKILSRPAPTGAAAALRLALDIAAVIGALVAVGTYLAVAAARLSYPFALEWIEPNSYLHVARVLEGKPIYGPPSSEFIAMIYPPLYFYIAAALAWPLQNIVLAMRLVSVGASLVSFGAIYLLARGRGLPPALCALAMGLFAATYAVSGYWFDVSRVDSLFLALLLLAYLPALAGPGTAWRRGALSGVILCLAFLTKQQAAVAFPFLMAYLLARREWGKAIGLGASFTAGMSAVLLAAQSASGGWFWFYTVTVPGAAPLVPTLMRDFWAVHVLPSFTLTLAAILCCLLLVTVGRRWEELGAYLGLLGALGLPFIAMSYMSMVKSWGFINGLMPLTAALALLGAEAAHHARGAESTTRESLTGARAVGLAVTLLLLAQLGALRYDPGAMIPTAADRQAGEGLVQLLRDLPGPAFAATAPYLLAEAGHETHWHPSSQGDLSLAVGESQAVGEQVAGALTTLNERLASGVIQTALIPSVPWYDSFFNEAQGYSCRTLPNELHLRTFNGAVMSMITLCTRAADPSR